MGDIGGILVGFLGIIATLQLAIVNCGDELNLKAICGAGIDGVFTVLAALVQIGPGMWLACDEAQEPLVKKALKLATDLDYKTNGMVTSQLAGSAVGGSSADFFHRRLE